MGDIHRDTQRLLDILLEVRNVKILDDNESTGHSSLVSFLQTLETIANTLSSKGYVREAETLQDVLALSTCSPEFGGLGLSPELDVQTPSAQISEILLLVSAWLEALNSVDRYSKSDSNYLTTRPPGRRGMTLSEKIFAAHDITGKGSVKPGDVIIVDVDWIISSEAGWGAMEDVYDRLGKPGIFRNDRFWLAGDHVVDPRVNKLPEIKRLIDSSERARKVFKMTEYQGMNYTIMHTEFFRERAEPGALIIGCDSHTCSSGAVGCLAIGLGVSDVTMPLITGQTWFQVPESIQITLTGTPPPGIGGKDVILYILKTLKRNTVAADRVVEFTGSGLQHLSCDARFAISNMCTEFGAITGIFVPDPVTFDYIQKRRLSKYKKSSKYFYPDEDAVYAASFEIDLGRVESFVALYPSPDNVVSVSEIEGKPLDGCFIGACTTTEEDLIIGAMVLEQGLKQGLSPVPHGKRKVVPGSLPILNKLRELGSINIYERAGFEIGIPGCSYCVGMSADRAEVGEVWLSSQNRNFANRMGTGSFGNLASAATVAASSFGMKITDPSAILQTIDKERLRKYSGCGTPRLSAPSKSQAHKLKYIEPGEGRAHNQTTNVNSRSATKSADQSTTSQDHAVRIGRVNRLGDFIDTDALAPAEFLIECRTAEQIGPHCLQHTIPEFRQHVKDGFNIVVAGLSFGCGSSREVAVSALMGCGVQCVIAKSFGYIYGRNQPSLGLLGITITDTEFYEVAIDGAEITIELNMGRVTVGGKDFAFKLSHMERELIEAGGISEAFQKFGKKVFDIICAPKSSTPRPSTAEEEGCESTSHLKW